MSAIARDKRARAEEIASDLIELFASSDGRTRDEVLSDIAALEVEAREQRLKDGLLKLLDDRSTWGLENALNPEEVRRALFGRATERRLALGPGERFDRGAVIAEVARDREATAELLEAALFADLRGANVLSRIRAALRRAARRCLRARAGPGGPLTCGARRGRRALRFARRGAGALSSAQISRVASHRCRARQELRSYHRRPHEPLRVGDQVRSQDGSAPSAARGVRGLEARGRHQMGQRATPAEVPSGKGGGGGSADPSFREEPPMPDELAALVRTFGQLQTDWKASPGRVVLDLPGVGLSVPDLVFQRGSDKIYLESLGYWSREAVFRRVDLVRQGLSAKIVFAVSSRLRVSEELLDEDASGALYVYKGTMSARTILSHLDRLSQR